MAPRSKDTVLNINDDQLKQGLLNGHSRTQEKTDSNSNGKNEKAKVDKYEYYKRKKGSSWKGFFQKMGKVWPYMWPRGDCLLQLRVIVCMAILVLQRGINVAVPILYKLIVERLTAAAAQASMATSQAENETLILNEIMPSESTYVPRMLSTLAPSVLSTSAPSSGTDFCWQLICLYMLVKSFQGGGGYLNCLRSLLWIRVAQNTQKTMRLRLFSHLHHLSMRWHVSRKTGEVIRVMDRGVGSITLILNHALFNIVPAIFDILVAVVFFVTLFNVWTGLIVFLTMLGYLVVTIGVSEWRVKFRRTMNDADNKKNAASVDSILNFETVKYYSAEQWETDRYEEAIDVHQSGEWIVNASMNLLNALQKTIMMIGLLSGSLLCAWYVYTGKFTVGDYVMFATYLEQLYVPLNNFGAYYRMLQQSFVDMENMFDMLSEDQEVRDAPEAGPLAIRQGAIEFNDVTFGYTPEKMVLHNISFRVPAGQTYALVGDSGGGKSTVIRLLFRFYDVTSGKINIDGQDISQKTQTSLRRQIGVVPQDTVLFNQDIRYNIRYGRVTASDEEVIDAARAAEIHNKILTFPDGYESKVGERGLKVSGGEKQRIAIARTILKAPEIVLLDEATSALDTRTERQIQQSLRLLCENKTTLLVAHRLSTVIHAHQILVFSEGRIVERGTHEELLQIPDGLYYSMWFQQQQNDENAQISDVTDSLDDDAISTHYNDVTDNKGDFRTSDRAPLLKRDYDVINDKKHGETNGGLNGESKMKSGFKERLFLRQSSVPLSGSIKRDRSQTNTQPHTQPHIEPNMTTQRARSQHALYKNSLEHLAHKPNHQPNISPHSHFFTGDRQKRREEELEETNNERDREAYKELVASVEELNTGQNVDLESVCPIALSSEHLAVDTRTHNQHTNPNNVNT